MQTVNDNNALKIKLLSSINLDEVTDSVFEIIDLVVDNPAGAAILIWDPDLESFGDRFYYGQKKRDLPKLCDGFVNDFDSDEEKLVEVELKLAASLSLDPVWCYRVANEDSLCACVLMFGAEIEPEECLSDLSSYPLFSALKNAWDFRELQRENERLRSNYAHLEHMNEQAQDQTHQLIQDVKLSEAMRSRLQIRDRMFYSITNAVRSSVHIQEVLDMIVEKICTEFRLSRCLLLRLPDEADEVQAFEFVREGTTSVRDLFLTSDGLLFVKAALNQTIPLSLGDPELDNQTIYDREFLQKLGVKSSLIAPIALRDRVLGVLFLQECNEERDWNIDDVLLIGSLADNLSVAIENAELHQEREKQAVTDGLTGIANRRSFNEMLLREFERAKRYEQPLSLIIIDLDHLKKINDAHGHQAGDEAIRSIGITLRQSSRSVDLPARYGGEEFCLLLPNTDIEMAEQLAERLRRLINEVTLPGVGNISASIGVATYPTHADDPDLLVKRSDEALYVAKQSGRNQVKTAVVQVPGQPNWVEPSNRIHK
jgi:diguanylate cyclase (GGDEF)-like protein